MAMRLADVLMGQMEMALLCVGVFEAACMSIDGCVFGPFLGLE